jgi:hypothetical protein
MKARLVNQEEVNLIAKEIIKRMTVDMEKMSFPYDTDLQLEDYTRLTENLMGTTIETNEGFKIVNVFDISEKNTDIYEFLFSSRYIIFPNKTVKDITYFDLINKNTTPEEIEKEIQGNEIMDDLTRECEISKDVAVTEISDIFRTINIKNIERDLTKELADELKDEILTEISEAIQPYIDAIDELDTEINL